MVTTPATTAKHVSIRTGFLCLIFGGVIMGFSTVLVRETDVTAAASAFWRVAFAIPLLLIWYRWERQRESISQATLFTPTSVFAGLAFAGDLTFWHLAILNTTLANATFTVCLAPVWVAVLAGKVLDEPMTRDTWFGLLACLMGLGLLLGSSFQFAPERLWGDICGIITSLFLAAYTIAMRAGRATVSSARLFTGSTIVTAAALLVLALILGGQLVPETWESLSSLLALGILTHAGGQGLIAVALGVLSAIFSSLVIFIEAIAAALAGWIFYGETMDIWQLTGGACVLAGVWWARPK